MENRKMSEPMTILVTDDNRDLANNIQDILKAKGYEAFAAYDGADALETCRNQAIDLAILDYKLPDMDGLQLQERLAEISDADYIIVTAHASLQSAAESVTRDRIVGYEPKPLDMDRLLFFIQQVSERRRAENAQKKSERMARTLLNIPLASSVLLDSEGICLDANDTFAERFGKTVLDIVGKRAWDLFPPEVAEKRIAHFRKVLEEKRQDRHEDQRQGMWTDSILTPILDDAGKVEMVAVMSIDITERKKAEQDRLEMERRILGLQRLESLGVMAAGIAHDFNNILTAVIGNIEMAMEDPQHSAFTQDCLKDAIEASRRATALVRQMLAYTGKKHFVIEPVNLNDIVEEIYGLLRSPLPAGAWLETRPARDLPRIMGDNSQLKQIILTMVTNAGEAMPEGKGGGVYLSTGVENCDEQVLKSTLAEIWMSYETPLQEGRYVYLEVADKGGGMGPEILERIFEPFFTTKFMGRGLGLPAMMGIVRAHKGFIRVQSKQGKGTVMRVLFPSVETAENNQETMSATAGAPMGAGGRVLVVDDDPFVLKVVRRMLESAGYQTVIASDGTQAVELFEKHMDDIDFVVLDLSIPRMTGVEAFEKISGMGCRVPVILSSGFKEMDNQGGICGHGICGVHPETVRKGSPCRIAGPIERRPGKIALAGGGFR